MDFNVLALRKLIRDCLNEDIGAGDLTTNSIVPAGAVSNGYIVAKEKGMLAGMPVAEEIFRCLDPALLFQARAVDGEFVERGRVLAEVGGNARAILTGERLALNFLQRLSGIATKTAQLVELVAGQKAHVIDTRKTTPGLRMLEKYAVRVGGGYNHRFGLYDAVLIKDNHIKAAGGIAKAVQAARRASPHTAKIEVEVESMAQVGEALEVKADIIMLDNMAVEMMREAVALVAGRALVEASGNVTGENIRAIAAAGVDLISVGALTHSVESLDISLDLAEIKADY
ncbi:carboxylating nicotinate-nucleotide diphosphorylase [Pelotomaculum terephthalicicum JT]|uniref:carboxylating nicotinate-nucleotide diphosphorylase n=1 Tax=Pelotomaculum TaxID=191373 RepID=UPI0009CF8719|nr:MULTISPECIES: carboxylating nicotinate-nucleotide diphosphorylase [Pelotomaculum]MCG9968283.1 carboxylating nicotinate-nucleotide diphosphorylase [Pelotomaculum terephthalicicum JT]OPX89512.1 MAG: putative nicotinate-nucleotide pyrophosphorylase (carboxylating) [Pelotomaculum sp. PtaB.Bin117]OPY63269.1 MAG: putative nicotinate-nucleotide pyrophosphorylase (carboxylating) [Pelotomaculum sp. PtaU1.Bin065]